MPSELFVEPIEVAETALHLVRVRVRARARARARVRVRVRARSSALPMTCSSLVSLL